MADEQEGYVDWTSECDEYLAKFMAGRDLYDFRAKEVESREEHDRTYERYRRREKETLKENGGVSKKYREEAYNKQSKCTTPFINNLHTYKTCDGGSGYKAEQNHYAVDFVISKHNTEATADLKRLKSTNKNKVINKWLADSDPHHPLVLRRAVSCIAFHADSLDFDEKRSELAAWRRKNTNWNATIQNIDATFLPEDWKELYQIDTSRLLLHLSNCMKHLIGHVNTQDVGKGEIKIERILFSTEDKYLYMVPAGFNVQKALRDFSSDYERWSRLPRAQSTLAQMTEEKRSKFFKYHNVVLVLDEYAEEGTIYRRARHVCELNYKRYEQRRDLYVEMDTAMLRIVETTPERVRVLPQEWAGNPPAILEARFYGLNTEADVARRIAEIRKSGRACVLDIDRSEKNQSPRYKGPYMRKWNTLDTVVITTYKVYERPKMTDLFCEDPSCRGMCGCDVYFKKLDEVAPAIENLQKLREKFSSNEVMRQTPDGSQLVAYILPVADAHQNREVPEHYARLKFVSGFQGTFGCAVITFEHAVLFTDNTHFKLAHREVDPEYWTIKNVNEKDTESITDWIADNVPAGTVVGFDPSLITYAQYQDDSRCLNRSQIQLVPVSPNLVDDFWQNRPFREGGVVKVMGIGECGRTPATKIYILRQEIDARKCSATVISQLDDVMWLLNIRGNDLKFSPLAYSYLLVTQSDTHLFIDKEKLDQEAQAHLRKFDVQFHSYHSVFTFLEDWWARQRNKAQQMIFLAPDTSCSIANIFGSDNIVMENSIVQAIKARKNPVELSGMRECNIRHSIAIIEFLHWIEKEAIDGRRYTEVQLAEKIEQFKNATSNGAYAGMSLPTVFSSGENSSNKSHKPVSTHTVHHMQQFLLQSGGHYQNGSALATRTIWDSERTEDFASKYTLVLKGHIQVASARFPDFVTQGYRLDVYARAALWRVGIDFDHDTGHGVGHYLNVREMPGYQYADDGVIEAGQVITIEPGYYETDVFGIQIGNCYETVPVPAVDEESIKFLEFKPLTLVPIQSSNIVKGLLTAEEVLWINDYHYKVNHRIGAILRDEQKMEVAEWLNKACEPI